MELMDKNLDTEFIDQHRDDKLAKAAPVMNFSMSLYGVSCGSAVALWALDKRMLSLRTAICDVSWLGFRPPTRLPKRKQQEMSNCYHSAV